MTLSEYVLKNTLCIVNGWPQHDPDYVIKPTDRVEIMFAQRLNGRFESESDWEAANNVPEEELVDEH